MSIKTILGLDLGTNSIGWALVNQDFENKNGKILGMGTRVIPMSQDVLGDFGKGNSVSQTAERTSYRSIRRLRERNLLRRQRLLRVLNILGFLPEHFAFEIDFEKRLGQFKDEAEPKLVYKANEFIFKQSFNEMLADFKAHQPELLNRKNAKGEDAKVPYDWTIYYLRKKALTQKIEKEELAWILLNFNQKRGYYQLRGEEEEENQSKLVEFCSFKIVDVLADTQQNGKTDIWYSLVLENGWIYRRQSKTQLFDWKNKMRDFIVTTELNEDGSVKTDKEGKEKRSFRAPGADDWTLLKKKTEHEIDKSNKTIGAYIYDTLLKNPNQKIKGKLVRTVERKFYKEELTHILQTQKMFHAELQNEDLYNDCVRELYKNNAGHQFLLSSKDIAHLFLNDIIFYQRPLKSQKSSIGNCPLESRPLKNKEGNALLDNDGKQIWKFFKVIPKSNPYYQEFRIWQWIYNLNIYKNTENVTKQFLNSSIDYELLYTFLTSKKEVKQDVIIKYLLGLKGIKGKEEIAQYRWNYVEGKAYPCNETRSAFITRLSKITDDANGFLTTEREESLWHIVYSVTDKIEYEKALKSFALKHGLDSEKFVENFKRLIFKAEYGSFSLKAIKKLLPLMRIGNFWDYNIIDNNTRNRIDKIISGEYDEQIKIRVREKAKLLTDENHFQGLPLWLAQYIVYDRHSEGTDLTKWKSPDDLKIYLDKFKQHSLRNPIVEQVITETLRIVNDIWVKYGMGQEDFFDEIHVELGREMKNTSEDRARLTKNITENENTNLRIKALLAELKNDLSFENVRPYSPTQLEILKIYEDGALNSADDIDEEILKISKTAQPTPNELIKYKLWLEQKYRSPYTGKVIPLTKLFTSQYEIEHIIPQSRYFDDSFNNKVICESAVNKLKDNRLGLEFIKKYHGSVVETGFGYSVPIFDEDEYIDFVNTQYSKNRSKQSRLLLEDIPDKMIERQLNDTRYISKHITSLLSNIVRSETNDEGVNSKNVLPGNGKVTSELKNSWGLNDVWNELILARFERMNDLTKSSSFTSYNDKHQKYIPTVPIEFSKGFQKKRIDHRHHALDALVIACATRDHVNLLNNIHAKSSLRYDLNKKLRLFERVNYKDILTGQNVEKEVPKEFIKPWKSFTNDGKSMLQGIIVSFKQNIRIINKTTNYYESYKDEDGNLRCDKNGILVKGKIAQKNGDSWAIRKPMHQESVAGLIKLQKKKSVTLNSAVIDIDSIVDKTLRQYLRKLQNEGLDNKKIINHFKELKYMLNEKDYSRAEVYYWEVDENGLGLNASYRTFIDTSFNQKYIEESVADSGIRKILLKHLDKYKGRKDEKGKDIAPEALAFLPEGIEEMNSNIPNLNDGKFHQPIFKVRTYSARGNKFGVGNKGNKKSKYVIAAKGTNLFFGIYGDDNGKRVYETIPLNLVIERQKQGLTSVPQINEQGFKLLMTLSPNDLVYINRKDEKVDFENLTNEQKQNVYKIVSFTGSRLYAIPYSIAVSIVDKVEFTLLNKMEFDLNKISIKENCEKLKIDRLGNILRAQ